MGEIKVKLSELLPAMMSIGGGQTPFQSLRRQPVPVSVGLKLIEIGKALDNQGDTYTKALEDIRKRHFNGDEPAGEKLEAFKTAHQELLDQEVTLPFERFPRAMISEAKLSTDDLQSLLWLFSST